MHEPNLSLGLTLWLGQWKNDTWEVQHLPVWGAEMWDEIWERTRGLEVTRCPVLAHSVTSAPGNQEAGQLAQV